jgi:hypothetical protein
MRVEEISLRDINRMSLEELVVLRVFLTDSTEENWDLFTLERLRSERNRLISKDIPESKWPSQLQGNDWEINLRKKLGLEPPTKDNLEALEKPEPKPIPEAPGPIKEAIRDEGIDSLPQRETKEPLKVGDPFKSDSFGTLLEETGDPYTDEILRMKREKR